MSALLHVSFLMPDPTEGERLVGVLSRQLEAVGELTSPEEVEDILYLSALCMDELARLRQEGEVSGDEFGQCAQVYVLLQVALHNQLVVLELNPPDEV